MALAVPPVLSLPEIAADAAQLTEQLQFLMGAAGETGSHGSGEAWWAPLLPLLQSPSQPMQPTQPIQLSAPLASPNGSNGSSGRAEGVLGEQEGVLGEQEGVLGQQEAVPQPLSASMLSPASMLPPASIQWLLALTQVLKEAPFTGIPLTSHALCHPGLPEPEPAQLPEPNAELSSNAAGQHADPTAEGASPEQVELQLCLSPALAHEGAASADESLKIYHE